ncbi:6-O-methylguanine DNA methyltransferase [Limtongia smithiae]|uniref:6-O-methylguanine DNA methyltransferase n=1 Tax=Limtongia smithiae TaxID=1125753 RepID=UPI0034CDB25A
MRTVNLQFTVNPADIQNVTNPNVGSAIYIVVAHHDALHTLTQPTMTAKTTIEYAVTPRNTNLGYVAIAREQRSPSSASSNDAAEEITDRRYGVMFLAMRDTERELRDGDLHTFQDQILHGWRRHRSAHRKSSAVGSIAFVEAAPDAQLHDVLRRVVEHYSTGHSRSSSLEQFLESIGGIRISPTTPDGAPSPLQRAVWKHLALAVPAGTTLSYAELASTIVVRGSGNGIDDKKLSAAHARAVGATCGSNRIGLLVPCHRILSADAGLKGYKWGLRRKALLLDVEGVDFQHGKKIFHAAASCDSVDKSKLGNLHRFAAQTEIIPPAFN